MMKRRLALFLFFIAAALTAVMSWLLLSTSGLNATVHLLGQLSGGRLMLEQASGRLYDHLQIARLHWQDGETSVEIKGISLNWSPLALLHGQLDIAALGAGDIDIHTRPDDSPLQAPTSLALPLDIRIAVLQVHALHIDGTLIADNIGAAASSRRGEHVIEALTLRRGPLQLKAHGKIAGTAPFNLTLHADLSGEAAEKTYALALSAQGTLTRSEIKLQQTQGPFALSADATLLPFAPQRLESLQLKATDLDLAALMPELPHTQIAADCRMLQSDSENVVGTNCRLDNALAGAIDLNRLPLQHVSARLSHANDALQFSDLLLRVGNGSLRGSAEWKKAGLEAQLQIQGLDAAALYSKSRKTALAGTASLRADAQGQKLELGLREKELALQASLSHRERTLHLERLVLLSAPASLGAQGSLRTDTHTFTLSGSLAHVDPARFLRTAGGDINGDFKAVGQLQKVPRLSLSFALRDSRFANAPASGRGALEMSWPHIGKADLQLDLGPNRVRLLGAFGRPGETLKLDIDAPALAPYGLDGDLQAHLQASGTHAAPLLNGQVYSQSLRLPGQGRVQKLKLDANMGSGSDGPLAVRLQLDRLDLAASPNALRQAVLDISGTRRQHAIRLDARLNGDQPLALAASGSFAASNDWQGKLSQLAAGNDESQYYVRLDGSAPLAFAANRWSVGPALLQTRNARIDLSASAGTGKLQLKATANNPRIGEVRFDVAAASPDAWSLSAQMPWQGSLHAAIGDLAWVNPLLGNAWKIAGRLDADIRLGGTPQYPLLNGQITGQALGLQQLDTGMQLRDGKLRANIRDSVLSLDEFAMESVLTSPPTALQRLIDDRGRALTGTPGRISAQGQMKLGTLGLGSDAAEQLHLDLTLDRLGVAQTPKQWLLLSGQSRLAWQQGKLDVNAKLDVDAARWELADLSRPQLSSDVIIHREGMNEAPVRKAMPWTGLIQVGMGRYFSFEGAGARGRLDGRVQIAASAQDLPRASGTVMLVDGSYDAYGQQLSIERGILNFQGLLENPALNILALRKGLAVEAGVEITGYAQAPKIRLVSEPTVPDAEKLSWLVLGRPPEQEGSDASVLMTAVSAMFGNDTNHVGQNVKNTFGIDELNVRSGTLGQQQTMNSRIVPLQSSNQTSGQVLAVGKQLSNKLRLSYEQALGGTGTLVKLTLKLSNRISVVGTSGSDSALDIFYGFAFGGGPGPAKRP